jgi:hypothetical protein
MIDDGLLLKTSIKKAPDQKGQELIVCVLKYFNILQIWFSPKLLYQILH